jgi:DNA polymerase zeta
VTVDLCFTTRRGVARTLRLHGVYYITKQLIPALGRVLFLVGADLHAWYNELPRVHRASDAAVPAPAVGDEGMPPPPALGGRMRAAAVMSARDPGPRRPTTTIDQFYPSRHCRLCDALTHGGVCNGVLRIGWRRVD